MFGRLCPLRNNSQKLGSYYQETGNFNFSFLSLQANRGQDSTPLGLLDQIFFPLEMFGRLCPLRNNSQKLGSYYQETGNFNFSSFSLQANRGQDSTPLGWLDQIFFPLEMFGRICPLRNNSQKLGSYYQETGNFHFSFLSL